MINKTNEIKMSESDIEEAHIERLLAKHSPIKVIQSSISTVNTCKQKIIEYEKIIKSNNQDKWNYCHHYPILPLLGVNHCLPPLHTSSNFFIFILQKNGFMILR